jgi:hypothetical protein
MKFLIRAALAAVMMSVAAVAMAAPPAHAASSFKYTLFLSGPPQELTDPFLFECYHLGSPQAPIISTTNNTTVFPTLYRNGDCTDNVGPPMSVGESRNLTLQDRAVAVRFKP